MPNNFYFGLLNTIVSDEKNSRTVFMLIAMPSAPFADMSSPISYKAFYLSNLLKLEDFFYQLELY